MTSPLLPGSKLFKGELPQSAPVTPQVEASKPINEASSTIVAPQGESQKTDTSIAAPQLVPDNGKSLPDLANSEPEPSPSQVVRRVTRRHKEILVIMSDTESGSPSQRPNEDRKSLSKQEAKDLAGNQTRTGMK